MSVKIEDLLFVDAIPVARRRNAGAFGQSAVVDTLNPSTGSKANNALVVFYRTGAGTGGVASAGAGSNGALRIGIRSSSGSTTNYVSGTLLPTTVSSTGLTTSAAKYAYMIDLENCKRYINVFMSNATSSATFGAFVLLNQLDAFPPTQPKASTATSKYGFTSITKIPTGP